MHATSSQSICLAVGLALACAAALALLLPASATARPSAPPLAGFAVWEADRGAGWRIFGRDLAGGPVRRLTRDEPGRHHCCAQIAPDGRHLAYLSLPAGQEAYPQTGATGELRLLELDRFATSAGGAEAPAPGAERVLSRAARTYFEHRAVVWRSDRLLLAIDGAGRTVEHDLLAGTARRLVDPGPPVHGWLLDPTLRTAVGGTPTFSRFDPARRSIVEFPDLGGCQPIVTPDGRWGLWIAAAGGPIRAVDLSSEAPVSASRPVHTVLDKSDPRLPADRDYLYFPMVSRDGTLLAWSASNDEHDHVKGGYDVFVAPFDPATATLHGPVRRLTEAPGADRYPDVWLAAPIPAPAVPTKGRDVPLVADRILHWHAGDPASTAGFEAHDGSGAAARFDPAGRMVLAGGTFLADMPTMEALLAGARSRNEISLDLVLRPERARVPEPVGVFTFSGGTRSRNLALHQEGDRWVVWMRVPASGREGTRVDIGPVVAGRDTRVTVSYTPGRLRAWIDGRPTLDTATSAVPILTQGFFFWRPLPLVVGGEWQQAERWRGRVERVTAYRRALEAPP